MIYHNPMNAWPWDAAKEHPGAWVRITDDHADYCLGVLPPIYFEGGFAVSEPMRDDEKGRPVYLAVAKVRGTYYARPMAVDDMAIEAWALRLEVG